jgi:hypothetical protein
MSALLRETLPMNPINLIHLVSEQTMQNLLPTLALRPGKVVQVRSSNPRFGKAAENLKAAVAAAANTERYRGLKPEFFDVVLAEEYPSLEDARRKVGETLSLWPGAVVNLTGGTKLMSIGAYLAACYQQEPVLYCDTARQLFLDAGREGRFRVPKMSNFKEIARSLNLEILLAAHGLPRGQWKSKPVTQSLLNFGERIAAIRASSDPQELSDFVRSLASHFKPDGKKYAASIPPLGTDTELKRACFQAAADAGLLVPGFDSTGGVIFTPVVQSRKANEETHKLLDGIWLELYVMGLIQRSQQLQDPHWSVEPAAGGTGFGETDILCVDAQRCGLTLVSCKCKEPGLEHFESIHRRSALLGGSHTRGVLCVFHAPTNAAEAHRLRGWANLLNITLCLGHEGILSFFHA